MLWSMEHTLATGPKGLKSLMTFVIRKSLRPAVNLVFCLPPPQWKAKPRQRKRTRRTSLN